MEDKSFLYFTQDDVLSKIDIDSRLVDSFKRVMQKLQEYFNANGYTEQRDYKEYLETFLFNSGLNNLRLYVNKIEKNGVMGFYSKAKNEICINEMLLNANPEHLDSTICHEFIHFLVKHSLTKENGDPQIVYGGFINESLTEMLTQQMYPNSNAYDSQVAMQKYANMLSGKVNNYSRFLQGHIDARYASSQWDSYVRSTNEFQSDFDKKGYITLAEAQANENYINAQRRLIELFIRPFSNKSFDEYCECIVRLMERPVKDQEFINKVVQQMDATMIRQLNINNPALTTFYQNKLIEVRELIKEQRKYNCKKLFEFEFAGRKLTLDENMNFSGNLVGISRGWNPATRTITLQLGNETKQFNFDEIDFNARDTNIRNRLNELSNYYSKDSKTNISMIDKAIEQSGELVKIEKFTLPMISSNGNKSAYKIFIATYGDKMVLLNNYEQIGYLSNIPLNRFIGMTSKDPRASAIYSDNIGKVENGIVFTTLNEKQIMNGAINRYLNQISNSISSSEIEVAIEKYKSGDFYTEEDTEDIIRNEALRIIAEEKFGLLPAEEKEKLIQSVKNDSDRFIVSTKDGKISVSALHGKEIMTAFIGNEELIYDSKGNGLYFEVFEELKKSKGNAKSDSKNQINISPNGEIIYPKSSPVPPTRDDSTFTQKEELDPTPIRKPFIRQEIREKIERENGYFDISQAEQHSIDERRKQQEEKEKLEEQRRELRRKQFAQRTKEMGIDRDTIINFDELERQQEMIDRINHEQEIIEDHGMHM